VNATEFAESVTRTITGFVPTGERFENTVTGRVMDAGTISFDCGHSYVWRPWGIGDNDPMPAAGSRLMCATCIDAALAVLKATS
jgi:hypothetical protein